MIPLMGIYPKEYKSGYNRDTCILVFNAALFIIAKLQKQLRCPTTDEGKQRPHVFSSMWKINPKDKHIHKNKHDHIQTYM
jgi:hypothetical protein